MKLFIKPFSVNEAWKGRRVKTDKYKSYEKLLAFTLPNVMIPKGKLTILLDFGFKNSGSDVDNPVKPFLDILQKKYNFNDNQVYQIIVHKTIVKKGEKEYIEFSIWPYSEKKVLTYKTL